ncbi:MAG: hypothetical protein R2789_13820 [Microthrixaceae bacterium]
MELSFKGGQYGFERGVPDGQWCDVWVYEDLEMPTGRLHAPAGMPQDEVINVPAVYEDFRPGAYEQTARLADMDANHVEAAVNFPNTFPASADRASPSARTRTSRWRASVSTTTG